MFINGITPPVIVVKIRRVMDGPIVKVEIGIPMPRPPPIGRQVALNDAHFRLPAIGRDFDVFNIKLLATFRYDMEFHPAILHMACCGDFDEFGAVLRAQHEGIPVACLVSVFVVVTAPCQFAFGIANPDAAGNRLFVVFNFELTRFTPVSHQDFNGLRPFRNFKEINCASDSEFVVIRVLRGTFPGGKPDTLVKEGACGNRGTAAFYPFVNFVRDAMLATEPVGVIIVFCIGWG